MARTQKQGLDYLYKWEESIDKPTKKLTNFEYSGTFLYLARGDK